ncbi:MAG: hypothetical protein ACRDYY_00345, partial [Acidimicrobiales bacterium]
PAGAPSGGSPAGGVVVVDRTGRVLASESTQVPLYQGVSWSPDGSRMAFPTSTAPPHDLVIWTPGHAILSRPFANRYAAAGGCVWSPDGTWVLCNSQDQQAGGTAWDVAPAAGGGVVSVPAGAGVLAPGSALVWVAAGPLAPASS